MPPLGPPRRQDDCASARSSAYGTLPIIGATKESKNATAYQRAGMANDERSKRRVMLASAMPCKEE
ncbi:MAG: hypothetical protein IJ588_02910 [Prevotella sp.]|nr:hypothetical protein [Prevotella sp.]